MSRLAGREEERKGILGKGNHQNKTWKDKIASNYKQFRINGAKSM